MCIVGTGAHALEKVVRSCDDRENWMKWERKRTIDTSNLSRMHRPLDWQLREPLQKGHFGNWMAVPSAGRSRSLPANVSFKRAKTNPEGKFLNSLVINKSGPHVHFFLVNKQPAIRRYLRSRDDCATMYKLEKSRKEAARRCYVRASGQASFLESIFIDRDSPNEL